MKYYLQNSEMEIAVQSKGAELTSIINKRNRKEYLWQADPAYWNRHAPVLFPIVGKLKDNRYTYEGEEYEMSQHGFARDRNFNLEKKDEEVLRFRLENQVDTYENYPFRFILDISYSLVGSTILVEYKIRNTDEKNIFFSIGAHPAFNCPITEGEKFEDYSLFFNEVENSNRYLISEGLLTGKEAPVPFKRNELPLSYSLFENDAIVLQEFKSDTVTLKSKKSNHGVRVSFPGFPFLGIWTKRKGAPFLCIEPWCGLADSENASGKIEAKEGINVLFPDQQFVREYLIEIF